MEEEKYQARIGDNKVITYLPDPPTEPDQDFLQQFQKVAATKPESIQEFFIRLSEIQYESLHQNAIPVNIELKNIKVAGHMSEETIAFTADLFINNSKVASVKNDGRGGSTGYQAYKKEDIALIKQAEEYCQNMPSEILHDIPVKGKSINLPMSLERYIEKLLDAHLQKKDLEQFHKTLAKHQEDSILFGIPDLNYIRLQFEMPIVEILKHPRGLEALQQGIQEHVLPYLENGKKILNTNLPDSLLNIERKRPGKSLIQQDVTSDNKPGQKVS